MFYPQPHLFPAGSWVLWPGGRMSYCPGAQSCLVALKLPRISSFNACIFTWSPTQLNNNSLFPKALIRPIAPAQIQIQPSIGSRLLGSPLELDWSRDSPPPYPQSKACVCFTVLLPCWFQHISFHVPLQQWSWLAWHFLQKL